MTRTNQLAITALAPTIGAVISGLDLRDDHADAVIDDVRGALLAHKVLFFEDQDLTPEQQRDFARRFGELHVHPLYPGEESVPEIMILDNRASGSGRDPARAPAASVRRRYAVGQHDRRL